MRLEDLNAQSWSLCEYLAGTLTPAERRERFRGLLGDGGLLGQPEAALQRHFGFDFAALGKAWREWVQELGPGGFTALLPHVEESLITRVIPLIEDRQANRMDRILAIRSLGTRGYALGADTLIKLLQRDDAIPSEEIVWALEAISGMSYGEDRDRWADWWSSLPEEVCEPRYALTKA